MLVLRTMDWDLNKDQDDLLGRITRHAVHPISHDRVATGLQPGLVRQDFPQGETLEPANIFIRSFIEAKENSQHPNLGHWDGYTQCHQLGGQEC